MIGDGIRGPLQEAETLEQDARAVREPRLVDLGAEVVLVEDELPAGELERQGERPERVGWIARLNDVESLGTVRT